MASGAEVIKKFMTRYDTAPHTAATMNLGWRAISRIGRQPKFIVAVVCGAVSYLVMNFLMTSAPLAMSLCGLPLEASNLGIQWHVIAMYGPSFFSGRLIARFGAPTIVSVGLAFLGAAAGVGLMGIAVPHFWLSLILLGVGWNFGFVGASALVLQCHRPEEAALVQSRYDLIVFGTVAVGSFSSGGILTAFGWHTVLLVSFAPLVLAIGALAWGPLSQRFAAAR